MHLKRLQDTLRSPVVEKLEMIVKSINCENGLYRPCRLLSLFNEFMT